MAKFKFYASTGYVGCSRSEIIEIDDEELEGMNEDEIEDYVWNEYYLMWVQEHGEWSFDRID